MSELNPQVLAEKQAGSAQIMRGVVTAGCGHLGVKLGLYRAMSHAGPLLASELADTTNLNERLVLEWLRQQAAAGVLEYRGDDRFELIDEAAAIYADESSPFYSAGGLLGLENWVALFAASDEPFRSGRGRPFSESSQNRIEDMVRGPLQAWARNGLVPLALPRIDGVVEALTNGAVVADIGCGPGAAPIAMAQAYPRSRVFGYDTWQGVLEVAERQRKAAGLDNVSFHNPEREPLPDKPTFDLVITMDCLHDMTRPDLVAQAIRAAIKPNGAWFIVDVDGGSTFEENLQKPMAAMWYGFSIVVCLQSGMAAPDGLALGLTGLPEPQMEQLVRNAGFSTFERLEGIGSPGNAYYVARP